MTAIRSWVDEMTEREIRLHGSSLSYATEAETKEQVGGYDVIECADLQTAIEVAAAHPLARTATVEVRPFGDFPGDE